MASISFGHLYLKGVYFHQIMFGMKSKRKEYSIIRFPVELEARALRSKSKFIPAR